MRRKCKFNSLAFRWKQLFGIIFGLVLVLSFSCTPKTENKKPQSDSLVQMYYCPMHPEVRQNHPGKCPKPECHGMDLVIDIGDSLSAVLKPVSSNVLSKITIINPKYKSMPVSTDALGYLDYDDYSKWDIASRYSGRIEKLYVKYNYQSVKKGDILFEIYSPDLVTAQENLLYIIKNAPGDSGLIKAARQKLVLLQLSYKQIQQVESSGKVIQSIAVYSNYDGYIRESNDAKMNSGEMVNVQKNALLTVKQGMYIESGEVLFSVFDPHKMIVRLQIKSEDIGKVKLKQQVAFYLNNDSANKMNGTIDFIEPMFNNNSKTLIARVNVFDAKHVLKIGSLASAVIVNESLETLWVPLSAVVDLGKNKIVWVSADGYFKAKKVETGIQSSGLIEIADGLTEADKIASEAHFLSDSEGFIKMNSDE